MMDQRSKGEKTGGSVITDFKAQQGAFGSQPNRELLYKEFPEAEAKIFGTGPEVKG